MLHDLIDTVKPGDEVDVTAIYRHAYDRGLHAHQGFPVFRTELLAVSLRKREDAYEAFRLSEEDEAAVLAIAKNPIAGQLIVQSIAPSIYGHQARHLTPFDFT